MALQYARVAGLPLLEVVEGDVVVVYPGDQIPECNDGNNKDAADNKVLCGIN